MWSKKRKKKTCGKCARLHELRRKWKKAENEGKRERKRENDNPLCFCAHAQRIILSYKYLPFICFLSAIIFFLASFVSTHIFFYHSLSSLRMCNLSHSYSMLLSSCWFYNENKYIKFHRMSTSRQQKWNKNRMSDGQIEDNGHRHWTVVNAATKKKTSCATIKQQKCCLRQAKDYEGNVNCVILQCTEKINKK